MTRDQIWQEMEAASAKETTVSGHMAAALDVLVKCMEALADRLAAREADLARLRREMDALRCSLEAIEFRVIPGSRRSTVQERLAV